MPPPIKPGEFLPLHPEYAKLVTARAFWRLTFRTGRDYVDGRDAKGEPVLYAHEREREGYNRRKRTTKPRNHAGPIIRRYNDFVFRTEATRPKESVPAEYDVLKEDADGHGTPLPKFMREVVLAAQIDRDAYILPDSTKRPDAGPMSKAQAAAAGVRTVLKRVDADAVAWWRDYDGAMVEAIVIMEREDGSCFGRWYGAKDMMEFDLDQQESASNWRVTAVRPVVKHGYDSCPLVRCRPPFDGESQISPLAESQQAITNYISLLNEEIFNVCFSQIVATGVAASDVKDVVLGNNRLLCLPNPGAKFEVIGADPAQAESIRKAIEDEQRELYRIAGVQSGDPTASPAAPESGVAKAFKFNDLAANLASLAQAAEDAENRAVALALAPVTADAPVCEYPQEFDLPELTAELADVIKITAALAVPTVVKRKVVERFVARNFKLTDEEQTELEGQLADLEIDPASADSNNPFPRRTSAGT